MSTAALILLNDAESLTCLSLLCFSYALHVGVDGNNSHVVDGVGIQVPQDGAGGAS